MTSVPPEGLHTLGEVRSDDELRQIYDLFTDCNTQEYLYRYAALTPEQKIRYDEQEECWYRVDLKDAMTTSMARGLPDWPNILGFLIRGQKKNFGDYVKAMTPSEQAVFELWVEDYEFSGIEPLQDQQRLQFHIIQSLAAHEFGRYIDVSSRPQNQEVFRKFYAWQQARIARINAGEEPDAQFIANEVDRTWEHAANLRRTFEKMGSLYMTQPKEYKRLHDTLSPDDQEKYDAWDEERYQRDLAQALATTKADWGAVYEQLRNNNREAYAALPLGEQIIFDRWSREWVLQENFDRLENLESHEPYLLRSFWGVFSDLEMHQNDKKDTARSAIIGRIHPKDRELFYMWRDRQKLAALAVMNTGEQA